ncbi:MAG: NAD(P)-binding protein [Alphaproteobacteria bacterium]|nr:NAD(P)-binding protein [Alphaproteobacteria bacterium]
MTKTLIIGGGFAGCIAAQMLSKKGHDVTLVERAPFLGGTCRTEWWGGHPYTLGPRHFLTKREDVWAYLDTYCPMNRFPGHEFLTYIERDQQFYHFPIHRDEVDEMPDREQIKKELAAAKGPDGARNLEEYWIFSVGPTLYDKYVNQYSKKMWGIESNTEITEFSFSPKGVALKTGKDKAAWTEAMSGFPKAPNGYDDYFPISTKDCTVKLKTTIEDFDMPGYRVKIAGEWHKYDVIVTTVSPEITMKNAFGALRWAGRDFFKLVLPIEHLFPEHVYFLYYASQEPFTRVVEYKKFYNNKSPHTLIGIEIPSTKNKLYPFPMKKDQDIHRKYVEAMPKNVFSVGRNATYRYLDVGLIIEHCMDLFRDV